MGVWVVVWARGRRKVDFSLKKVGVGTPNPRVKKFGVIPKPHKFFRVGQRSRGGGRPWRDLPRPAGAARTLADANKFMGFRGYPKFFDSRVRGTPTFLTKNRLFVDL